MVPWEGMNVAIQSTDRLGYGLERVCAVCGRNSDDIRAAGGRAWWQSVPKSISKSFREIVCSTMCQTQIRRNAGLCTRCGKREARRNMTSCSDCAQYQVIRQPLRREKTKARRLTAGIYTVPGCHGKAKKNKKGDYMDKCFKHAAERAARIKEVDTVRRVTGKCSIQSCDEKPPKNKKALYQTLCRTHATKRYARPKAILDHRSC